MKVHPVAANIDDDNNEHGNIKVVSASQKDHYMVEGDQVYAGQHIIVDFFKAQYLDDIDLMREAFKNAIQLANATLLHIHLHHFTPNDGVSGVAVLAESHISVHTWPERDFAAFDIFMCGDAKPMVALDELKRVFKPESVKINVIRRGLVSDEMV